MNSREVGKRIVCDQIIVRLYDKVSITIRNDISITYYCLTNECCAVCIINKSVHKVQNEDEVGISPIL